MAMDGIPHQGKKFVSAPPDLWTFGLVEVLHLGGGAGGWCSAE